MPPAEPTDFDDELDRAVADWRERYRIREDDAVLLLVELFRVHQRHWDELRRREMPPLDFLRADIVRLSETMRTTQTQSASLLEALRKLPSIHLAPRVTRTAAFFAALASGLAGYLIGRAGW